MPGGDRRAAARATSADEGLRRAQEGGRAGSPGREAAVALCVQGWSAETYDQLDVAVGDRVKVALRARKGTFWRLHRSAFL